MLVTINKLTVSWSVLSLPRLTSHSLLLGWRVLKASALSLWQTKPDKLYVKTKLRITFDWLNGPWVTTVDGWIIMWSCQQLLLVVVEQRVRCFVEKSDAMCSWADSRITADVDYMTLYMQYFVGCSMDISKYITCRLFMSSNCKSNIFDRYLIFAYVSRKQWVLSRYARTIHAFQVLLWKTYIGNYIHVSIYLSNCLLANYGVE